MAQFAVKVALTYYKELTIYADDEDEASEKAVDLCSEWKGVEDVEVLEISTSW